MYLLNLLTTHEVIGVFLNPNPKPKPKPKPKPNPHQVIGVFLNRLSDFLFVAARLDAHSGGASEQRYAVEWRVDRWQRQLAGVQR